MTGTEFGQLILNKRGQERETALLNAVSNGQFPGVFSSPGSWPVLVTTAVIDGKQRRLSVQYAPDFFATGTAADPFYIGGWPNTSQSIANSLNAILPSHKLANEIHKQALIQIPLEAANPGAPWYKPGGIPGDIENSGAFIASNKKRNARIASSAGSNRWTASASVDGHMKNVLTKAGGLAGSCPGGQCVTIYGGLGGSADGWAVQAKNSSAHSWNYGPDYSHGIRLIHRFGKLDDGSSVDLVDVFRDPKLHVLVSDEGPFDPRLGAPSSVPVQPPVNGGPKPVVNIPAAAAVASVPLWLLLAGGAAAVLVVSAVSGTDKSDESDE